MSEPSDISPSKPKTIILDGQKVDVAIFGRRLYLRIHPNERWDAVIEFSGEYAVYALARAMFEGLEEGHHE